MKRVVSVFLICVMLLCVNFIYPKEAHAFAPALVVPVVASGYASQVAAAMVAAGVCFATKEAAEYGAQWLASSAPSIYNDIKVAADNAVNNAIELTQTTWEALRTWVQGQFIPSTAEQIHYNSELFTTSSPGFDGCDMYITDSELKQYCATNGALQINGVLSMTLAINAGTDNGKIYDLKWVYDTSGGVTTLALWKRIWTNAGGTLYSDWAMHGSAKSYGPEAGMPAFRFIYDGTYPEFKGVWPNGSVTATVQTSSKPSYHVITNQNFYYTGADVLTNPTWDITNTEGKRMVYYPTNIANLQNRTYEDVLNPDTVWEQPQAGTGEVDFTDILDNSTTVNLEPLRVAGELFTNRFPFSLPWDLYNSFAALSLPGQRPEWNISINSGLLKGFNFTIDLSMFDGIVPYVKGIELFCFDMGLILITRKLLGGAA